MKLKGAMIMEITYTKQGEIMIPDIALENKDRAVALGKFAMMRLQYLKEYKKALYQELVMKDKLTEHLKEIDQQANQVMEQAMKVLMEEQQITETMKEQNQIMWVQMMNNLQSQVEEAIRQQMKKWNF